MANDESRKSGGVGTVATASEGNAAQESGEKHRVLIVYGHAGRTIKQPLVCSKNAGASLAGISWFISLISLSAASVFATAETWRGLTIAPESRCSAFNRKEDYPYRQSVESRIIDRIGLIYGPYTARCFASEKQTDIEHIVAVSEAHDSGLCGALVTTRRRFAQDLLNLTLAGPKVNRHQKSDRDAAEWLPLKNQCWFANQVVKVKRAYGLSVDAAEAAALKAVLSKCDSTDMVIYPCTTPYVEPDPTPVRQVQYADTGDWRQYDDNQNGRVTCAEAKRHGIAPVYAGHPAYAHMRDADKDGVVCE